MRLCKLFLKANKDPKHYENLTKQLLLQINELERFSLNNIEEMENTIDTIYTEVKAAGDSDSEEEKFIRDSTMIPNARSPGIKSCGTLETIPTFNNKKSMGTSENIIHPKSRLSNLEGDFTGYLDTQTDNTVKRRNSEDNKDEVNFYE